ncbi:MAG TPA: hypothetical protein VLT33_22205 [Labilithrix sp.]|nr:hypothetical protein [Labilithrix sp.]
MRSYLFLSSSSLVAVAVVGLSVLGACSSSSERQSFTDDSGITPTLPPQQTKPDARPEDPVDPVTDASAEADAPDTCKRTGPSNKCGLAPQCGCTLAETCEVQDGTGNVDCVTAGLAAMGAACVNTSGCARGLTCMYGTCHAYCDNPGSACKLPKTGGCEQVKNSGGTAVPNLSICRVACELRDVTACGASGSAGTGVCQVDSAGNTDCVKGGTRAVGQVCTPTDDCGPGLVCAGNATSGNTCRKWCRVGTNDCGGAVACTSFTTKVMVGAVEYAGCP